MKAQNSMMPTRSVGSETLGEHVAEIWRYRHLCFQLAAADLQSRFRRSSLGVIWVMIHPLAFTMLYSIVLSSLFKQDFRDFSIYVFSGFILWDAINSYMNLGAVSLINAQGYIKQSPIPLLLFPVRVTLTITFVLLITFLSFAVYSAVMVFGFGVASFFSLYWLWAVPVFAAMFMLAIPVATIFGLLNLKFRDTQQLLVILTQALWFSSPVFFARELFDVPQLRLWAAFNPVVAICDVFRDPVLHGRAPEVQDWITIGVWTVCLWIVAIVSLAKGGRKLVYYL